MTVLKGTQNADIWLNRFFRPWTNALLGYGDDRVTGKGNSCIFEMGPGNDYLSINGSNNLVKTGTGKDSIILTGNNNIVDARDASAGTKLTLNGVGNAVVTSARGRTEAVAVRVTSTFVSKTGGQNSVSGDLNKIEWNATRPEDGGDRKFLSLKGNWNFLSINYINLSIEAGSENRVDGSGNDVSVAGSSSVTVAGDQNLVRLGTASRLTVFGTTSNIFSKGQKANIKVNGNSHNIHLAHYDTLTLNGSQCTIFADGFECKITINGSLTYLKTNWESKCSVTLNGLQMTVNSSGNTGSPDETIPTITIGSGTAESHLIWTEPYSHSVVKILRTGQSDYFIADLRGGSGDQARIVGEINGVWREGGLVHLYYDRNEVGKVYLNGDDEVLVNGRKY